MTEGTLKGNKVKRGNEGSRAIIQLPSQLYTQRINSNWYSLQLLAKFLNFFILKRTKFAMYRRIG